MILVTCDTKQGAVSEARPMGAHTLVVYICLGWRHRRLLHFAASDEGKSDEREHSSKTDNFGSAQINSL
jgi:hypothetical protein